MLKFGEFLPACPIGPPVRYQPATTASPTTAPPRMLSRLPRKSRDFHTNQSMPRDDRRADRRLSVGGACSAEHAREHGGHSWVGMPCGARLMVVAWIHGMKRLSNSGVHIIRYAAIPPTTRARRATSRCRRRCAPSCALPQPLASVMPIPNRSPPTR